MCEALPERCETCNMYRVTPDTPVTCPKCLRGNVYKKPHTKAVEGPGRAPSCKKGRCKETCPGRQQGNA